MNALKLWALKSAKALVGAVVAAVVPVLTAALLELPAVLSVPASAAAVGGAVYAVRNR